VRHRQQVLTLCAVGLRQRDERASGVVQAAVRDADDREVSTEPLADLVLGSHRARFAVTVCTLPPAERGLGMADDLADDPQHDVAREIGRDLAYKRSLASTALLRVRREH
jgi:hypothetical protein